MKRISLSSSVPALAVLALSLIAHCASAQVLNNGRLRFGNGTENSVNDRGNLQQPFYFDPGQNAWYPLTFSNYPLDNAVAIGGDGANEWNISGTITDVYANGIISDQSVDAGGFIPLSGSVGHGTLVSTATATLSGQTLELRNTYELGADNSFIKITTRLTNTGAGAVSNVRVWVGTRDDFVGITDTPTKTRGNLDSDGFAAIDTAATRSAALQITSGEQGVLFYSSSLKAYTAINNCCQFSRAYNQNPATSAIQQTNDGSYALFVRMEDLAVGASEEFTWYYAAGAIADLTTIIDDLAEEVANVNVTSAASAGGSITPASFSVAPGTTVQFTVTPDAGYRIDTVQGCSGSLNGTTYTTGAISTACNVSATFALNTYQVTATAGTGGGISPANATVAHGQTIAFTVVPADGYIIDAVSGCGGSLAGDTYTTAAVTGACGVNASFRNLYTVSATVSAEAVSGGTISPTSVQVEGGAATSFTLTPATGFSIGEVSGCNGQLDGNTYSVASVSASCAVVANFVLTVPTFQIADRDVFNMNATELLTELPSSARPQAVDFQGAEVPVTLTGERTRYAPGQHTLTWRAVDSRGAVRVIEQVLNVWPTVTFGPDLSIGARAGNFDSFRIALNGRAPIYPFTVSYTVSGDSQGTTLDSGQVVFENDEVEKEIPFAVQTTSPPGTPERTIQVSLDDRLNRGSTRPLTITLTTINQAPRMNLQLSQSGEERLVASRDSGPITFSAGIEDPDTADTHAIEWRAPAGATYTVSGASIIVDPSSLPAGVHRFELIVTDNGSPPVTTRRTFDVVVLESLPVLPDGATRLLSNGLPDSPAYAPVAPNVLPERGGELSHHLMEADAGTRLSLGSYAMYHGAYQTELPGTISALQIPDDSVTNLGGYFDFVVDGLPRVGDSVAVVIPQRAPIPAQPVYRKYDPTLNRWQTFFEDNDNRLASAPGVEGFCPPPSSSDYRAGLNPGDWCVRLTIKDGGVNDTDGAVNGSVSDPGGIGSLSNVQVTGESGGGGGSLDLMVLIGGVLLLLVRVSRGRAAMMALALLSVAATQASADEATSWYAGAQFGSARSDVSAGAIDAALSDQGYDIAAVVRNKSRDAWRIYGGYELTRWLAVEAGYSDLGEVDVGFAGAIADINQFLSAANALQPPSAEGFDLAAVVRYSLGSHASVHARAGAFFWDARYETRNIGGQVLRRNDHGWDALASIGVQVNVFKQWSLGAEFTRYGIDDDHIDFAGVGIGLRW